MFNKFSEIYYMTPFICRTCKVYIKDTAGRWLLETGDRGGDRKDDALSKDTRFELLYNMVTYVLYA